MVNLHNSRFDPHLRTRPVKTLRHGLDLLEILFHVCHHQCVSLAKQFDVRSPVDTLPLSVAKQGLQEFLEILGFPRSGRKRVTDIVKSNLFCLKRLVEFSSLSQLLLNTVNLKLLLEFRP